MKKQAILFSAGEYIDSKSFPKPKLDLSGVKYDVQAIEKRLQQIGFSVVKKENASKADYISTLQRCAERCARDAISIVYFSGHGGHYIGKNYIFPSDFTTLFDSNGSLDEASINIEDIISVFKGKGRLILILDACRKDVGGSKGYYSEMVSAEDVYIAYGTLFDSVSVGVDNKVSWFTEAICDEILAADIDVDELFTRIRQNIITRHKKQLPPSVNTLLDKVYLHTSLDYQDLDEQVYNFVEKYGDIYQDKYGYFSGESLVFIDASQFFNIGLLDAYWSYTKVQNKLAADKGIRMPQLSEAEQKIVSFLVLRKDPKHYSFDCSHTWYYNGRQIRMGEIPPLPPSMQQKMPEEGKALKVEVCAEKSEDMITVITNLPDGCKMFVWDDKSKYSKEYVVSSGNITICNASNISKIVIDSNIFADDPKIQMMLGDKNRNSIGQIVKYHPIHGNMLQCSFDFCTSN